VIENTVFQAALTSPARKVGARVELHEGETLVQTFSHTDAVKSITVDRVGEESKFFGFGVCQKLNLKLIDVARVLEITTAHTLAVEHGIETDYLRPYPLFDVTEVHRDENTNELSVTAYDAIYKASGRTVAELGLTTYTIEEFATACASLLGLQIAFDGVEAETLAIAYENGANFEGSETIRDALTAVAEVTQTIYFVNNANVLTFKRLSAGAVATIGKDQYFTLESGENRRLATIAHVTELGDNVSASITETGTTQEVRSNPFWDLREDIAELVNNALVAVGGMTINQFECKWRGNFLLQPGDCIELVTKDNGTALSYVLNDTIEYTGFLSGSMQWQFTESESASTNPTSLGEAIKETFARVDKANKRIELVASETADNKTNISQLQLTTSGIEGIVKGLESKVETQITEAAVKTMITTEMANGVDKVQTTTGFTFDENGLTVEKSTSEMSTTITEDGMQVFKDGDAVLTANNNGVDAKNLHATTYLIVGANSRFEDYEKDGEPRTGCFWIGG
jgi:hypothetical protein